MIKSVWEPTNNQMTLINIGSLMNSHDQANVQIREIAVTQIDELLFDVAYLRSRTMVG